MNLAALNEALATRYIIDREIGRGGMATVYLARDLKHDRLVALKLLNPELGAILGEERFLSEIRVTANLQHPNLLPLFDSGAANGMLFYVMPFVEGESLRARLERDKQLPIEDALRIALAVANALDYAHAHGVVHRDLKPENILLQHGEAVVADFGIALAVSNAGGNRITQTGLSLGTPQYMSPEQATGDRAVDGRSDVYSLGAVLYEMLGGEAPHTGTSGQAIIAKLMTEEPRRLSALRRSVPPHVEGTVHRALEKLPADRWATAREFAEALRGSRPVSVRTIDAARSPTVRVLGVVAAAAVVIAAIEGIMLARHPAPRPLATLRFPFVTSDSARFSPITPAIPFAISADDRRVVYVGVGADNVPRLYVKGLDDMQTRVLPNTERPLSPAFSPDGQWVVANLAGRLAKIPVDGGPVATVLPLNGRMNAGSQWFARDTILVSVGGVLQAVPADGGTAVTLTRPDTANGEVQQWGPRPVNARYVAYVSIGTTGLSSNRIGILDRKTGRAKITRQYGTTVIGAVDGHVIWVTANGAAMAAPLDAHGDLGAAKLVLEDVLVRPGGAAKATMSAAGSLIYQHGVSTSRLMLVDDHGIATPLGIEPRAFGHPRWSPDGSSIAVAIGRTGGSDIWLIDAKTRIARKLTSASGSDDQPAWSADGKRVFYRSIEPGGTTLKAIAADGSAGPVEMVSSRFDPYSGNASHDGKWILFRTSDLTPAYRDVFAIPAEGDRTPRPIVTGRSSESNPALSPDDRWLLYASDISGRPQIYLRPFPGPGPAVQVSRDGGTEPTWSPDGRLVFYRAGRTLMAATVSLSPLAVSATRPLFDAGYLTDGGSNDYDVAPDGKHFLMLESADRETETIFVYRWADELRKAWQ